MQYRSPRRRRAARNDNTRRSFGLIKGVVRQMLRLPPATADHPQYPDSASVCSGAYTRERAERTSFNGAARLPRSVMVRHFALASV